MSAGASHPAPPHEDAVALFSSEYQAELESWLHHRFRHLCVAYLIAGSVLLVWASWVLWGTGAAAFLAGAGGRAIALVIVAYHLLTHGRRGASRSQVLRSATRMILSIGLVSILSLLAVDWFAPNTSPSLLLPIFVWHASACAFLPWTPRESMRPFVPLFGLWAVTVVIVNGPAGIMSSILEVLFGPTVFLPGLAICAWRLRQHSAMFRSRMVDRYFVTMRRELIKARSIHEGMFPQDYDDGFVQFQYAYAPAHHLGGDFVHLHVTPGGVTHVCVLDVTGHGVAAALTTNRLYGELERIRGESPDADPGDVIALLNRYVYLTMARHNIYVTGVCVRLDPYAGELTWASAGHPPGFVRSPSSGVRDLPATTVVLGAWGPEEFIAAEQTQPLDPGDMVVLVTDGIIESRNREGRFFGIDRLREILAMRTAPRRWAQFIETAVQRHASRRIDDDMLIAELTYKSARLPAPPSRALAASSPLAPDGQG